MPKMPKQRTLAQLLEPSFAEGYDAFREIVEYTDRSTLPAGEKAWLRFYELISVAMIEAINRVELDHGVPPLEGMVHMWGATGAALATVNAQAFLESGASTVRREMLGQVKHGYDRGITAFVKGVPS